jgi:hypothetical protein
MSNQTQIEPSEAEIRERSYLIWDRERRQDGCDGEYWLKAKAELKAELEAHCHCASLEGSTTLFVLSLLPISNSPLRTVADRMPNHAEPDAPSGEVSGARSS